MELFNLYLTRSWFQIFILKDASVLANAEASISENQSGFSIIKKFSFALILLLLSVCHVSAQSDQAFVGTRPLALGETFVAIADDGNTIYWNPAGLARMERIQVSFAYSDLFGIGISSYYASFLSRLYFIPPLTDYVSFGVDWLGIQNRDEEIDFHHNKFNFALAFKPPKSLPFFRNLGLGVNAKYVDLGTQYVGITELDAKGWGWDIGILYHLERLPYIPGHINLGMMVHDVTGTQMTHDTGVKETVLPQNIRLGFCYRPFENFPGNSLPLSDPIFAIDIDDRIHFGWEIWLWRTLALRAGIQKDLHTNEKMTLSFGLGFKSKLTDLPETNIDYALTDSPVLPNTAEQFGGSIIIKENPRLIRIEGAHIQNVFASLYLHYASSDASIGQVKLKNVSKNTLKAWISLKGKQYMELQKADTVYIAPDASIDFPLRAVFKPEIFHAPDGQLSSNIIVKYIYNKNEYPVIANVDFKLYGKNYLTWDDAGKAAAFVTYDDPLIQNFVDRALKTKLATDKAKWFCKYNMAKALTLFNALQAYGLTYRVDPVTPFPSLADTLHGALYRLDKIQYPAEFLMREECCGDCDDICVLYASLLQNAGLATALVSVPGHIFIMVNSGIHTSRILALPIPPELFFKWNNTLWIPIETTMIPTASFIDAWKTGADFIHRAKDQQKLEICEVAVYQQKYPPVSSTLLNLSSGSKLKIPQFKSKLHQDLNDLENLKTQYFQSLENMLSQDKPAIRNRYGIAFGQNGEHKKAKVQLKEALVMDSTYAPAWNNMGNIEFMRGNLTEAESLYTKALDINPFSCGTYLNLAILYQIMIDSAPQDSVHYQQRSDETIERAAQLLEGKVENAFAILGLEETGIIGKATSLVENVKKKLEKVKSFVDISFTHYRQRQDIQGVVLELYDLKCTRKKDEHRGEFLFWSN